MKNKDGSFNSFEDNPNCIDYYLGTFCEFHNVLNSLLRKDPETRRALLEARYKDVLLLKVQTEQIHKCLHDLLGYNVLSSDTAEYINQATNTQTQITIEH